MPALNTDLFLKLAPNTGWQLNASGITDASSTSFGLVSTANLPTDTAILLTIDRVDGSGNATPSKMERIVGVVSGSNIVSCIRGVEGTAQAHAGGAIAEIVIASSNWNKIISGFLAEHNQDGSHNMGAFTDSAIVDLLRADGWQTADAMTYASATTFTVAGDQTAKYTKGTKIKLTNGTAKYFYVVSSAYSSVTTVTVTGETDLANSAITSPYYSYADCPQGFIQKPFAKMTRNTAQSIANVTSTFIILDTSEFSSNGITVETGNNRIVSKISGYYNVTGYIRYADSTGGSSRMIELTKNHATTVYVFFSKDSTGTGRAAMSLSEMLYLAKGDYIEIKGFQDSGGNLNVDNARLSVEFISV